VTDICPVRTSEEIYSRSSESEHSISTELNAS